MFERFSHVMVYVADLDRAVGWYKEKLGFNESFVAPGVYASLREPNTGFRLDLHSVESGPARERAPVVMFQVKELDGAVRALREKGVEVDEPPCEGGRARFAMFSDSEGNGLGMHEEQGRA
jgi:predicted enzyme related to lactoylglutathione lyase